MYLEDYDVLQKSWGNRLDKLHREKQWEQLRVCADIGKECTDFDQDRRPDAQDIVRRLDEVDIVMDIVNRSIVTDMSNISIAQEEIHKVEEHGDGDPQLFGAIGSELSLKCLLRLSRLHYGTVASLNRKFRSLVRNGEIYRLRRLAGVAEHWIYFCDRQNWKAYDLERRCWIKVPHMPGRERSPAAEAEHILEQRHSLAVGTDLLVFDIITSMPCLLRYSILTNSWIETTDTTYYYHHCQFGSTSVGQKAYLAGGKDAFSGRITRAAAIYDSEEKVWEHLPVMNRDRLLSSVAFMDGKLYVISGLDSNNNTLKCGEEYDFGRGSWRVIDNMVSGDLVSLLKYGRRPFFAVVNNDLYAVNYFRRNVNKYDMQNNRWITLGKLPERFHNVVGFKACGDKLIIAGSITHPLSFYIHHIDDPVEIYYWVPSEQPPAWNLIAGHPSESLFLLDFTVMSC